MNRAIASAGETMDALVWRVMGNAAGLVESALALNPHLVGNVILPVGALVNLPPATSPRPLETITLWN